MSKPTLLDRVRDLIGAFGFKLLLWSLSMTAEEFWDEQEKDALRAIEERQS